MEYTVTLLHTGVVSSFKVLEDAKSYMMGLVEDNIAFSYSVVEGSVSVDKSHGSPWDRGSADSYYGRGRAPHYYPKGSYEGERVTILTPSELAAYEAGYDENEKAGSHKDYR